MIEFTISTQELDELRATIPNFEILLSALKENSMITLLIIDDDQQ